MTRKLLVEILEDRFAPALVLGSGPHQFNADPGQDLVVPASASVEFTADVATAHTITSDNGIIRVAAGATLTCPSISGGALQGPGTFIVGNITGSKLAASATVQAVSLNNVTSNAFLTISWGSVSQFTNGSGGRLIINGPVEANGFMSQGRTIIAPTGSIAGNIDLFAGSVTVVQRIGPVDQVNDGTILGDVNIVGGLLENHGLVGVNVSVGAGAKAIGSGMYVNVLTHDGGTFSPGGSQSTQATFGGDLTGRVGFTFPVFDGTISVFDPDQGQSGFAPQTVTGRYGSLTMNAAGNWEYVLDPNDADLLALLGHVTGTNDPIAINSLDGTTAIINVILDLQ